MALSDQQRDVLRAVAERALTAREVAEKLNMQTVWTDGYDVASHVLRRLYQRGLVRRSIGRPAQYEISAAGEDALRG